jgi:tetratricopeptide (TPR) repeat protein
MLINTVIKYKLPVRLNSLYICCVFLCLIFPKLSVAQDRIYKTDSSIIEAKIQEVGISEIRYKKFNNLNGPTYVINKTEVRRIVYENGDKEYFSQSQAVKPADQNPVILTPLTDEQPTGALLGNQDFILTQGGEKINCSIDRISAAAISYHIKRFGPDTKGNISLSQVKKYFYLQQWFYADGATSVRVKARNFLLTGRINDAIALYNQMVLSDSANAALIAEDAYSLALGGVYDAALMRLDRSWSLGSGAPEVNYFTSQVFALMGYNDLAAEFWKTTGKYHAPEWIADHAARLLLKYKSKNAGSHKLNHDALVAIFKRANELASQNSYFQSIALFQKIINDYPNEYLPYVGYSITLEKTGAIAQSAQTLEKAITLVGNKADDYAKKQILEQRLATMRQRTARMPMDALPGLYQPKGNDINRPLLMAYAGGMVAPSMVNISGRFGYFISDVGNTAIDMSFMRNSGESYFNMGMTVFAHTRSLVGGGGFALSRGNEHTSLSLKLSVGVSKMNKKNTSSTDIFLDFNVGVTKNSFTTFGLTLGKSIYFGKRKQK